MTMTTAIHEEDSAIQLLYALTQATREAFGLSEEVATVFAERLSDGLRRSYACEKLYIPAPDKQARNAAIRREFNGRNEAEIRRRHGIGRSQLYKIIRERE